MLNTVLSRLWLRVKQLDRWMETADPQAEAPRLFFIVGGTISLTMIAYIGFLVCLIVEDKFDALVAAGITASAGVLTIWFIERRLNRRRIYEWRRDGCCTECGYDLRQSDYYCPECGSPIE